MNNQDWRKRAPWPFPPPWASSWGDDPFGLWADFTVADVVQRMRWIEAGSFMMGSPPDEQGRYDDEGPQHRVHIGQGFWLADTACTQGLWLALMGQNPSHFQSEGADALQLPVEKISWHDAQAFLQTLAKHLPAGLWTLPTEAEWEYACRAGTATPFYFGANISTAQVNYDGNYPYGGAEKGEYRERTLPVKALPANAWGLYQMHGNVWEWCDDEWQDHYLPDEALDPGLADLLARASGEVGRASRVIRGGSWLINARYARSAYRPHNTPDGRRISLGLRFACRSRSQARPGLAG